MDAFEKLILLDIGGKARLGECTVSNPTLAKHSSADDSTVRRKLASLEKRGLIERSGGRNSRVITVTQKGWALLAFDGSGTGGERAVAPAPPPTPEAKPEKKARKKNPTIEEHANRELPDWMPREAWAAFVAFKHNEKGPFSEAAAKGVIREVELLREEGHDPQLLLELAARRGWATVYPDKDGRTKRAASLSGDRRNSRGQMMMGGRVIL